MSKRYGLVRGSGHGCIVEGPNRTLWAFYTCCVCYEHIFERRIGFDPAGIDEKGNLFVHGASEIPQWAPGITAYPENGNDAGLLPVTFKKPRKASSCSPGRDALYALDDSMLTWWQPLECEKEPYLEIDLLSKFEISAARVILKDINLDYDNGILPGAFQYRIEALNGEDGSIQEVILDCMDNDIDLLIDYRTFNAITTKKIRFVITGAPKGIEPGVISFTLFGKCAGES